MSVSARVRACVFVAAMAAGALAASIVAAQDQDEPTTTRDYCIKVTPGKDGEFRAFLRDTIVPLNQAAADAGRFSWYAAAESVVPAGSSATCDYRMVYGYPGLAPEPRSRETLEADLKAARLNMTADQFLAKRSSLTSLVAAELWWGIDSVGPRAEKGAYVRLNHYKVNDGDMDEWVRMEKTYWKPVMEAWLKDGGKGSWSVNGLWMPSGDSLPYNAMTVDIFPDWNGLMRGLPVGQLWPKVHPDINTTQAFNLMSRVRGIHDRDVYRIEEIVRGTAK
jgi:hypothetical protein